MPRQSLRTILQRSYQGRRVLVTGHSGFVGTWLSQILLDAGAEVTGFSLEADPECALAEGSEPLRSISGDIRDRNCLQYALETARADLVFHLAAQSLVGESFVDPVGTLETNVIGTANLLESLRERPVRSCVVITSDKCYQTAEGRHTETDPLGGDDPYSASKAAAELVVHAYNHSFFSSIGMPIATARAGNIIGGGDWAKDRIVPDCIRAIVADEPIRLRSPKAVRPWQHVLDAVAGYLRLGDHLFRGVQDDPSWNFGPGEAQTVSVEELVDRLVAEWRAQVKSTPEILIERAVNRFPEREALVLSSARAIARLGWTPLLGLEASIGWTVECYLAEVDNDVAAKDLQAVRSQQIERYLSLDEARIAESGASVLTDSAS